MWVQPNLERTCERHQGLFRSIFEPAKFMHVRTVAHTYRSKEQEARLAAAGIESQVCEKGSRGHPLTEQQKAANHQKSKTHPRIEHVFGAQAQMGGCGGGHWVRTIGIGRARVKIALMNLACNMRRYVLLCKRAIQAPNGFDGRGASAAA